jgi:glycosyltransferase involved in cell wall biosynthesis
MYKLFYDARPLLDGFGPAIVIREILMGLAKEFSPIGIAPSGVSSSPTKLISWPGRPGLNFALFNMIPFLHQPDVFWGTNHLIPVVKGRTKTVVTVHDLLMLNGMDGAVSGPVQAVLRRSLSRADMVVCSSQATADELIGHLPTAAGRIAVVPLAYQDFGSPTDPRPAAKDGVLRLAMFGAHRPRKNLGLVLGALDRLVSRGCRVELVLTGRVDPAFAEILKSPRPYLRQIGQQPSDRLANIASWSDAIVFPSRYEGFGMPALEAMAQKRLLIALDTPVMREVAGTAALLLPDDVDAWAAALQGLYEGADDAARRVDLMRENLSRFSWARTSYAYNQLFSALVGSK